MMQRRPIGSQPVSIDLVSATLITLRSMDCYSAQLWALSLSISQLVQVSSTISSSYLVSTHTNQTHYNNIDMPYPLHIKLLHWYL